MGCSHTGPVAVGDGADGRNYAPRAKFCRPKLSPTLEISMLRYHRTTTASAYQHGGARAAYRRLKAYHRLISTVRYIISSFTIENDSHCLSTTFNYDAATHTDFGKI